MPPPPSHSYLQIGASRSLRPRSRQRASISWCWLWKVCCQRRISRLFRLRFASAGVAPNGSLDCCWASCNRTSEAFGLWRRESRSIIGCLRSVQVSKNSSNHVVETGLLTTVVMATVLAVQFLTKHTLTVVASCLACVFHVHHIHFEVVLGSSVCAGS